MKMKIGRRYTVIGKKVDIFDLPMTELPYHSVVSIAKNGTVKVMVLDGINDMVIFSSEKELEADNTIAGVNPIFVCKEASYIMDDVEKDGIVLTKTNKYRGIIDACNGVVLVRPNYIQVYNNKLNTFFESLSGYSVVHNSICPIVVLKKDEFNYVLVRYNYSKLRLVGHYSSLDEEIISYPFKLETGLKCSYLVCLMEKGYATKGIDISPAVVYEDDDVVVINNKKLLVLFNGKTEKYVIHKNFVICFRRFIIYPELEDYMDVPYFVDAIIDNEDNVVLVGSIEDGDKLKINIEVSDGGVDVHVPLF